MDRFRNFGVNNASLLLERFPWNFYKPKFLTVIELVSLFLLWSELVLGIFGFIIRPALCCSLVFKISFASTSFCDKNWERGTSAIVHECDVYF